MLTERVHWLHQMLKQGELSSAAYKVRWGYARSTFQRDLDYFRDRLHAPVEYQERQNRWRYTDTGFELPGFWLSDAEIDGLLVMDALLSMQGSHLLSRALDSIRQRLAEFRGITGKELDNLKQRVRHYRTGQRGDVSNTLPMVAHATLARRQISIDYDARNSSQTTKDRTLSPQRLSHYRNNWYLTAWCHLRGDLRNFSLDAMRAVRVLDAPAEEIAVEAVDAVMSPAFGIISATEVQIAHLRVSQAQSRWVADEHWHVDQQFECSSDGSLLLKVPFSHPHEIAMEVLRHGGEVEVISPLSLRQRVSQLAQNLANAHR